jgi:hypothetical protein
LQLSDERELALFCREVVDPVPGTEITVHASCHT